MSASMPSVAGFVRGAAFIGSVKSGAPDLQQEPVADSRHLILWVRTVRQWITRQQTAVERVSIEPVRASSLPKCAVIIQHRAQARRDLAGISDQRITRRTGVPQDAGKLEFDAAARCQREHAAKHEHK